LAERSDIEQLQTTGATPVHNPLSNLRLGRSVARPLLFRFPRPSLCFALLNTQLARHSHSGIAPVLKYLDARINVYFGCDGAASNDSQDMLEVRYAHAPPRTHTHHRTRTRSMRLPLLIGATGDQDGLDPAQHHRL
jgi:cytosine/adenosine deaminase-related metal-dependent hydrolase